MTPWTVAHQAPLFMGFYRPEYWSGWPCSPPGDLPNSGTEPRSSALRADSLSSAPTGKPRILEWVTYPFSRGTSQRRDQIWVSCIAGGFLTSWATQEAVSHNSMCTHTHTHIHTHTHTHTLTHTQSFTDFDERFLFFHHKQKSPRSLKHLSSRSHTVRARKILITPK